VRHRLVLLGALVGVEHAELAGPRGELLRLELALGLAVSCCSTALRVAGDRHVGRRLWPSSARLTSTWMTLRSAREARRPAELDDPVEARADGEDDVGFRERRAARVQEGDAVSPPG
jgi:hypothetical protein